MGRKVHPVGFRIGIIRTWQARWHADKHYKEFLHEDLELRKAILSKYADTGISLVEIERQSNKISVTIHTARPGIIIGRGGQRVDETRRYLEDLLGKKIQLNIQEIRQPELDAYLVARTVAEQILHRIAYRRAIKQALFRTMQAGAKGMKIKCSGRLGGAEIARREMMHRGQVPLHTLRADIDYGFTEAHTTFGSIGIKVWINRGEILPELKETAAEEIQAEPAASTVAEAAEVKPAKPTTDKAEEVEAKQAKPRAKKTVAKTQTAEAPEVKPSKPPTSKAAKAKAKSAKSASDVATETEPPAAAKKEETDAPAETD